MPTPAPLYPEDDPATLTRGPVWAHWHGGAGYSSPYPDDPPARFATIGAALAEHDNAYRGHGFTGEGDPYSGDTPCVEGDAVTWIYLYDPRDPDNGPGDPDPDYLIECQRDPDTGQPVYDWETHPDGPPWIVTPA